MEKELFTSPLVMTGDELLHCQMPLLQKYPLTNSFRLTPKPMHLPKMENPTDKGSWLLAEI